MRLISDDPLSEVLTIEQAARLVDRRPATIRDWIRLGRLTPMRVGRRTYVTERAVLEAERNIWRHATPAAT